MALLDDDSATELFSSMKLDPKDLEALDKKLAEHGDEPRHVKGPDVMDAGQLRLAFAELGDTVEREQLFALMQQADPESEGVMPLERFLLVVRARREQLEKARREKEANDPEVIKANKVRLVCEIQKRGGVVSCLICMPRMRTPDGDDADVGWCLRGKKPWILPQTAFTAACSPHTT